MITNNKSQTNGDVLTGLSHYLSRAPRPPIRTSASSSGGGVSVSSSVPGGMSGPIDLTGEKVTSITSSIDTNNVVSESGGMLTGKSSGHVHHHHQSHSHPHSHTHTLPHQHPVSIALSPAMDSNLVGHKHSLQQQQQVSAFSSSSAANMNMGEMHV